MKMNRAEMKSVPEITLRAPKRTAKCAWIDNEGNACQEIATVAIECRARGDRAICYCEHHADFIRNPRPFYGYFTKNYNHTGTPGNGDGWTYGCELETSRSNSYIYSECVRKAWIPTADSTVHIEYKSPVYHGQNAFVRDVRAIAQAVEDGALEISPVRCGTHTHIGHSVRVTECMEGYRAYSYRLMKPLADVLQARPDDCKRLFGRTLGYWADYPVRDSQEHRNYINLQHNNTVEFRVPLMRNATQYLLAADFCRAAVSAWYENFGKYWKKGTESSDSLKHRADIAGQKLCKLFDKYVAMISE